MQIDKQLYQKYNQPTPRYTSYPPANYFKDVTDYNAIVEAIKKSNEEEPQNISIYIHIPFCGQLCTYCGCNTLITKNQALIDNYIDTLLKEIDLLRPLLNKDRKISQIHWGGGTPNYLPIEDIQRIMHKLYDNFETIENAEIAMECHPGHLTKEYVDGLVYLGFNRLSFGIQDFDEKVLDTVNRQKPLLPIDEIISHIKSYPQLSLNLDFIYGLPYQNLSGYKETITQAAALSPDRLAVFSYAHVPWVKKQQKSLEKFGLPSAEEKIALFEQAYDILTENDYVPIGLDHFAKPKDVLSKALKTKQLHRNFQGYCTLDTTGQVYALGVSGISQMTSAYMQNTKSITKYIKSINKGVFPIEKYYFVNDQEKMIRDIIEQIMCNMYVDFNKVANTYHTTTEEIYQTTQVDMKAINDFQNEGILNFENNILELTRTGQYFMRNVAASFDPNMKNNQKSFSKAL
jgi:oxygen-independent coproporphyrinogen-3 oxidase